MIDALLQIKQTGITIERFRKILAAGNYTVDKEVLYFINPNYEIKYKLKPIRQNGLVASIPYVRDILSTACYCVASPNE